MAAGNATWAVPVSYLRERSGVRLLELPRELAELISSQRLKRLFIKSAAVNTETTNSGIKRLPQTVSPYAVLCTDSQTYQLRQVQSSNSVLVVRPAKSINTEPHVESNVSPTATVETVGLNTIATCSSFLELSNLNPETVAAAKLYDAVQWLRVLLLEYDESVAEHGSDDDVSMANAASNSGGRSKDELFDEIPFSQSECEDGWRSLCAFELRGAAVAPSAETLLRAWKEVFLSFDLSKPINVQELRKIAQDVHGIPLGMIQSIVLRSASNLSQSLSSYSVLNQANDNETIQLEKTATAALVGEVYFAKVLYFSTASERKPAALSLNSWQALLPESWRPIVTMELLATLRHERFKPLPTSLKAVAQTLMGSNGEPQEANLVELVNAGREMGNTHLKTANTGSDAADTIASKPGRNRNWHEKFRKARDAK